MVIEVPEDGLAVSVYTFALATMLLSLELPFRKTPTNSCLDFFLK